MVIVWSFLAGLLVIYGIPYFLGGLKGQQHTTPLGQTSAKANIVWGWVVLIVGAIFLHLAHNRVHPVRGFIFFAIGALVAALLVSDAWPKRAERHGKK